MTYTETDKQDIPKWCIGSGLAHNKSFLCSFQIYLLILSQLWNDLKLNIYLQYSSDLKLDR